MDPEEGGTIVTRRPHPLTWALVAVGTVAVAVLGMAVALSSGDDATGTDDRPVTTDDAAGLSPREAVELQFGPDADLIVFMQPTATDVQIGAIAEALAGDGRVEAVEFRDQDAALQEFEVMFSDDPELADVTAEMLPSSFHVAVAGDDAVVGSVRESYADEPGVREVVYRPIDEVLEQLEEAEGEEPLPVGELPGGATAIVFFHPWSTEAQRQAVVEELEASPLDIELELLDQEEAYEQFSELFSDDPQLVESVSPEDLPPSINVIGDLEDAADVVELACGLASRPGVREVTAGSPYEC